MIGDSAETWEEDVLPDLRSELSKIMGNNVDEDNLSVQDSIILTSLQSIIGSEAEDTKKLLSDAHIYAEGVCPSATIGVLNWRCFAQTNGFHLRSLVSNKLPGLTLKEKGQR